MKSLFTKYIKPYLPLIIVVGAILVYNLSNWKNVEGLDSDLTDLSVSFCKKYEGNSSELEGACGKLTSQNCKNSNCCVWANGNKCSAGGITGPTYKTDKDGNKITIDNYYYMNKCYGNGCPK